MARARGKRSLALASGAERKQRQLAAKNWRRGVTSKAAWRRINGGM